MELKNLSDTKIITLKDMGNEFTVKIRLFKALEGVYFINNNLNAFFKGKIDSINIINELLPLAQIVDKNTKQSINGDEGLTLEQAGILFKNPLTIFDLAFQVLEFQKVFTMGLEKYQPYFEKAQSMLNMKTSESTQQ